MQLARLGVAKGQPLVMLPKMCAAGFALPANHHKCFCSNLRSLSLREDSIMTQAAAQEMHEGLDFSCPL